MTPSDRIAAHQNWNNHRALQQARNEGFDCGLERGQQQARDAARRAFVLGVLVALGAMAALSIVSAE